MINTAFAVSHRIANAYIKAEEQIAPVICPTDELAKRGDSQTTRATKAMQIRMICSFKFPLTSFLVLAKAIDF